MAFRMSWKSLMGVVKVVSPFTIVHPVVGTWHPGGARGLVRVTTAGGCLVNSIPRCAGCPRPGRPGLIPCLGAGVPVGVQPQGHRAQFRGHGLVPRLAVLHVPAAQVHVVGHRELPAGP